MWLMLHARSLRTSNRLHPSAPYLAIFEQGGSADIFALITGGGGRDGTSKNVIVTLSNLGGATAPPPPARYGPVHLLLNLV